MFFFVANRVDVLSKQALKPPKMAHKKSEIRENSLYSVRDARNPRNGGFLSLDIRGPARLGLRKLVLAIRLKISSNGSGNQPE